jgi:hypothetical protein
MTRLRTLATLLPLAALLGACQTSSGGVAVTNRKEFEQFRTLLRLSEADRKKAEAWCIERFADDRESFKRVMAIIAGVSPEQLPEVICQRLLTAMAKGTITYDDFKRR